jgi:hypothetical protein
MTQRRPVQVGDVLAVVRSKAAGVARMAAGAAAAPDLEGRVVSTDAIVGARHGCYLVYIYEPGVEPGRDRLLVPPMLTTHVAWAHGYFAYVRSEPLLPGDFFEHHSFRAAGGQLYDEESRPIDVEYPPVGVWRLFDRVELIEEAIAAALAAG